MTRRVPTFNAEGLLYDEGIGLPTGILAEMKHTWTPASTPVRHYKYGHKQGRPCILRWHKGGLEQLYFCKESRQAKWKKVPKEEDIV